MTLALRTMSSENWPVPCGPAGDNIIPTMPAGDFPGCLRLPRLLKSLVSWRCRTKSVSFRRNPNHMPYAATCSIRPDLDLLVLSDCCYLVSKILQLIELSTFAKERSVPGVTRGWAMYGRFVVHRRKVAQGMDLTLSFGVLENSQINSQKSNAVPS